MIALIEGVVVIAMAFLVAYIVLKFIETFKGE
jgi:hypothetical protein